MLIIKVVGGISYMRRLPLFRQGQHIGVDELNELVKAINSSILEQPEYLAMRNDLVQLCNNYTSKLDAFLLRYGQVIESMPTMTELFQAIQQLQPQDEQSTVDGYISTNIKFNWKSSKDDYAYNDEGTYKKPVYAGHFFMTRDGVPIVEPVLEGNQRYKDSYNVGDCIICESIEKTDDGKPKQQNVFILSSKTNGIDEAVQFHWLAIDIIVGPEGGLGPQGIQGIPGKDGEDGEDGTIVKMMGSFGSIWDIDADSIDLNALEAFFVGKYTIYHGEGKTFPTTKNGVDKSNNIKDYDGSDIQFNGVVKNCAESATGFAFLYTNKDSEDLQFHAVSISEYRDFCKTQSGTELEMDHIRNILREKELDIMSDYFKANDPKALKQDEAENRAGVFKDDDAFKYNIKEGDAIKTIDITESEYYDSFKSETLGYGYVYSTQDSESIIYVYNFNLDKSDSNVTVAGWTMGVEHWVALPNIQGPMGPQGPIGTIDFRMVSEPISESDMVTDPTQLHYPEKDYDDARYLAVKVNDGYYRTYLIKGRDCVINSTDESVQDHSTFAYTDEVDSTNKLYDAIKITFANPTAADRTSNNYKLDFNLYDYNELLDIKYDGKSGNIKYTQKRPHLEESQDGNTTDVQIVDQDITNENNPKLAANKEQLRKIIAQYDDAIAKFLGYTRPKDGLSNLDTLCSLQEIGDGLVKKYIDNKDEATNQKITGLTGTNGTAITKLWEVLKQTTGFVLKDGEVSAPTQDFSVQANSSVDVAIKAAIDKETADRKTAISEEVKNRDAAIEAEKNRIDNRLRVLIGDGELNTAYDTLVEVSTYLASHDDKAKDFAKNFGVLAEALDSLVTAEGGSLTKTTTLLTITNAIESEITTEVNRAKQAEGANTAAITVEANTARAAEKKNADDIAAEAGRATAAERKNSEAIESHHTPYIKTTNTTDGWTGSSPYTYVISDHNKGTSPKVFVYYNNELVPGCYTITADGTVTVQSNAKIALTIKIFD